MTARLLASAIWLGPIGPSSFTSRDARISDAAESMIRLFLDDDFLKAFTVGGAGYNAQRHSARGVR